MVDSQQTPPVRALNLSKRPYSSYSSHQSNSNIVPLPKKRKLHTTTLAPAFWDGLSQAHLTKNALRELNRRNAQILKQDKQYGRRCLKQSADLPQHIPTSVDEILESISSPSLKRLKRFASNGGPALEGLRGHPVALVSNSSMSQSSLGRRKRGSQSPSKNDTPNTTSTRSTGPYDRAFQQHLVDHNILPDGYEYPDGREPPEPENMQEILDMLAQPRPSLSPSRFTHDDFRRFKRANSKASKERKVTTSVIPIIEGDVSDGQCGEIPFSNLHPLTDGTLVPGKPDLYYGARPEQLDRRVRKQLGGFIVPSTQEDLPILPNFFMEVKGPDGSPAVAKRQLTYDMSLGARGFSKAECYAKPTSTFDNHARTLGCTYQDGNLKMYSTHLIPPSTPGTPSGAQPGYVTTQVMAWSTTGSQEGFRQGVTAYRNGRDWAKQQRDEVIEGMNKLVEATVKEDQGRVSSSEASVTDILRSPSQDTATDPTFTIDDPDSSADELGSNLDPKRFKTCDKSQPDARTET